MRKEDRNGAAAGRAIWTQSSCGAHEHPLLKTILGDSVFLGAVYDTGYLPEMLTRIDVDATIAEIGAGAGAANWKPGRRGDRRFGRAQGCYHLQQASSSDAIAERA